MNLTCLSESLIMLPEESNVTKSQYSSFTIPISSVLTVVSLILFIILLAFSFALILISAEKPAC